MKKGEVSFSLKFIVAVDFLLSFIVFFICRYCTPGEFPRWYWLVLTSLIWVLFGLGFRKLQFARYKRKVDSFFWILFVDIVGYALLYLLWLAVSPDKQILGWQWLPLPILIALELLFCYLYRRVVMDKIPFLYENEIADARCERGIDRGIKLVEARGKVCVDLQNLREKAFTSFWKDIRKCLENGECELSDDTFIADDFTPDIDIPEDTGFLICLKQFNDCRHINQFLQRANECMPVGANLMLHGETSDMRKDRIIKGSPKYVGWVLYTFDYLWHRVCPKLSATRKLYMNVTGGHNRNLPRVEILGRVARAGFTIVMDELINGEYYVGAVKTSAPLNTEQPKYGPLIRLSRISKGGKMITVYKFRTMFAYSEYLQDYVFDRSGTENGGKIRDDFRINVWGMIIRSVFIDELPMFINLFRGQLKLVGIRPVSVSYFNHYSPEMKKLRLSVKPGIIPPLYYDYPKPKDLLEIHANEKRYIEAYNRAPFRTDWKYFWHIFYNLVFRRMRSR